MPPKHVGTARAVPGRLAITTQFPGDYYVENDGRPRSPESTLAGTSSPAPAPQATRFPMPHEPQRTLLHDSVPGLQQVRPGSNRISSAAPPLLKLTSYGQMFPLATMSLFPCRVPIAEPSQIRIAAGWFSMGSETGQDVEGPVHRIWVDSFAMAATQVTVAEYARFLDAAGNMPPPNWGDANFNHPQQPVVAVSWFDAVAYCAWLSAMTGSHYRLPTEAEWERAARGGAEGMVFPWGNDPPTSRADYHARWKTGPEPVGQSQPNAYGLFEMCENVHEWCSDWFGADYYSISPDRNPPGPQEGNRKASRGGSWRHHIKISRCSARSSIPPEFKYADYGFRVVRRIHH